MCRIAIPAQMTAMTFEFITDNLPPDGDLQLVLAECRPADSNDWHVPAYKFHLQAQSGQYMGRIHLRIGWNENVIRYAGQVGYAVEPQFRGHRYAERACRLILPLARRHGLESLWITCQPDNLASRRTLERLGASHAGTLDVPTWYPLDAGQERRKMCFRLSTSDVPPGS
jgi:tagatose 1,6-diphosphate aldolase